MKAVIIGAGIGGLLCGAKLSKQGYDIEIYEKLPFIGGRFANLNYKGYTLSTGALHMIPHGTKGPFAQLLNDVGAKKNIVDSEPVATIRKKNGEEIIFKDIFKEISITNKLKIGKMLTLKSKKSENLSFKDWIIKNFNDEFLLKVANSFCGWSLSLMAKDVPTKEIFEIIKNMLKYKGPGVIKGGCGAVIESLSEIIYSNNGKIYPNSKIDKIIIKNNKATGVKINNTFKKADVVISDIGHAATSLLYECNDKEYLKKIHNIKPSKGIKISISSDKPLLSHNGVLFTPFTKRINGLNEVTNSDKSLAPKGKHLIMSHQTILSNDLNKEIKYGLSDIKSLFKGNSYEILMIQSYHNGWPVNRAASGTDIGNKTPINNLYIVGDGAKAKGGIEIEGIALGVKNLITMCQT